MKHSIFAALFLLPFINPLCAAPEGGASDSALARLTNKIEQGVGGIWDSLTSPKPADSKEEDGQKDNIDAGRLLTVGQLEVLRDIAATLGAGKSDAAEMDAPALISEIKDRLSEATVEYSGEALSDGAIADVEDYLSDVPKLFKIIKRNNSFVKSVKGKRVIIVWK